MLLTETTVPHDGEGLLEVEVRLMFGNSNLFFGVDFIFTLFPPYLHVAFLFYLKSDPLDKEVESILEFSIGTADHSKIPIIN